MHSLRPYQRQAIDAVYAYWDEGGGNALIEAATGTGKSLIIATLCKELVEQYPSLRIGIVAHVKELIQQNCQEMIRAWPGAPVGIFSAGIGRRDTRAKILFCGIQSVHNKVAQLGGFDLLIIDECHLLGRSSESMYGKFIADCRALVPDMRLLGLTATPFRLDSGRLDGGEGALFDKVVFSYGIGEGVRDGFLSPLISKATLTEINVGKVAVRGGEFVPLELQAAAMDETCVRVACAELVRLGADRRAWLIFATGVSHAWEVAKEIRSYAVGGVEVVSGETPSGERDRIIAAYRAGQIRCLVNVNVLTTGFNVPHVDLIGWMRPTLSTGLYVQGTGRGTRKADGKADCLVLDWAGNIRRHGPIDDIQIADRSKRDSGRVKVDSVRAKECPSCNSLVGLSTLVCPHCNHEWPRSEKDKHEGSADGTSVIMKQAAPRWLRVLDIEFHFHSKPEKPPTFRIDYQCGVAVHRRWICFEHEGYARGKAEHFWRKSGGRMPIPATVKEALSRAEELTWPREILVRPSGKFFEIIGEKFPNEADRTANAA
ncbi:MAG TPA: DEAD/DEAH box helicase family protein [Steroidobacteraceae bacterium]|nr:DEAD/DEAH box helicase family protein [Steroidobacteraceae bacterium]